MRLIPAAVVLAAFLLAPASVRAGAQVEESLAANVQNSLHRSVSDYPAPRLVFATESEGRAWLADMASRLVKKMPDWPTRRDFLITVQETDCAPARRVIAKPGRSTRSSASARS